MNLQIGTVLHEERINIRKPLGICQRYSLRITDNGGNTVMEFPILADAAADEYVAEINQKIQRAKGLLR